MEKFQLLARLSRYTVIAVGLRFFVFACDDMRQDELDCEEAVAHLQACCPGLDVRQIACTYVAPACESSATYPDISIATSQCIRARDCGTLQSTSVCQRAAQIGGNPYSSYSPSGSTGICP